jgi:hypothetical protein
VRRLPDRTPASSLILEGRDEQALHALVDLTRRACELCVEALEDGSLMHQQVHTVDGHRRTKEARRALAERVRRLEAVVDLLRGTL